MVRQAEVLAGLGVEAGEAISHGEQALTSVPAAEAEPLLARLSKLTDEAPRVIDIYERQVTRCKAPSDKLAALGRAASVAAGLGAYDKARAFFDLALGGALSDDTLNALVVVARAADAEQNSEKLRRTLAEALANGGQGSRDGGRTRGMLLGRAAELAYSELKDTEQAFTWLGDAIVSHVDDEPLAALERLADEVGEPRRAEAVLSRALEEVFDGPLVRKLLARRAAVRREKLADPPGAAADLKRLHDLSPADTSVMDQLSLLYVELEDYRGMVQLYEDQILRGKEPAARAELARNVARLWQERLNDPREAADAWRRVLRMKPGDPEAVAGLELAKANMLKRTSEAPSGPPHIEPPAAEQPTATPEQPTASPEQPAAAGKAARPPKPKSGASSAESTSSSDTGLLSGAPAEVVAREGTTSEVEVASAEVTVPDEAPSEVVPPQTALVETPLVSASPVAATLPEVPEPPPLAAPESAAAEPAASESAANESAASESAANESAANESAANESAANESAANESAANESAANESAANESAANESAASQAAETDPASADADANSVVVDQSPPVHLVPPPLPVLGTADSDDAQGVPPSLSRPTPPPLPQSALPPESEAALSNVASKSASINELPSAPAHKGPPPKPGKRAAPPPPPSASRPPRAAATTGNRPPPPPLTGSRPAPPGPPPSARGASKPPPLAAVPLVNEDEDEDEENEMTVTVDEAELFDDKSR